uniref:ANK_REP_REGION domain-containing protein n=1 Tax=Romanomermis culicivorax TaxID=13658 RepID=A0A915JYT2_ROMCU
MSISIPCIGTGTVRFLNFRIGTRTVILKIEEPEPIFFEIKNRCTSSLIYNHDDSKEPTMTTPECSNNNADYNQPLHQIFVQEKNRLDLKSHNSTLSSVDDSSINFARAAVLNDDRITVKKLLETDLHILNSIDILGRTLLIYAVSSNKFKIVKHLIRRGANINFRDKGGRSSLYWAVHCDHVEIVKLLLHNNADYTLTDENGASPLHESVKLSSTKCLKSLKAHYTEEKR